MSDFNEPLAFGLDETWIIDGVAYGPDGEVLDLTGATLTFAVSVRGGAEVFSTTSLTVTAPTTGAWALTLSPSARASADPDFAERVYAYSLTVTTSGGLIYQQNAGSLTLTA